MIHIDRSNTDHDFKKINLITLKDSKGCYDEYKCSHCGLEGKARSLQTVAVRRDKKCTNVKPIPEIKEIEIINCKGCGEHFANLVPGSKHLVINPPKPYKKDSAGVWVMGNGEPVKVLNGEFKIVGQ